MKWYGAFTREDVERRAVEMAEGWRRDGVHKWMAYDKATGELIGRGGLSRAPVDGVMSLELGWIVFERYWGMGYASEIGGAGLAFAFDELGADEVVAFTERANKRSVAVMERLGMRYTKSFLGEDEAEYVVYSITR